MNGDGEDTILDEITKGALPSNVRVELVAEPQVTPMGNLNDNVSRVELVAERDPLPDAAGLVHGVELEQPIGIIVTPQACGQNYVRSGRIYPEKCSLPGGHKPRSSTADHYCFGIGWWVSP